MHRFFTPLIIAATLCHIGLAEDSQSESETWNKKYQQLLKDRPEIRNKVERGGATKEEVIEWMKKGGDRQKAKGDKKYYGAKISLLDPSEFQKTQGKVVYSGPQPGEELPSFNATGLRGKHKGEEYDPVAAAAGKPLVLIFQDNSVVGQKGLLLCGKALATIAEKSPNGLEVSAVFLVDDPDPERIFEYDFMDEITDVIDLSVSPDRREGPGVYGLNRNVAMTVLVARDGKVLHSFALAQPMLYPDPHVFGAIAEAIGVQRQTITAWFSKDSEASTEVESEKRQEDESRREEYVPDRSGLGRDSERRRYTQRKLAVKDPAGFKTDGKQIFSGPQLGELIPPFKAASLAGDTKGKEVDPTALAGDKPQILFFQDESGVAIRGLFGVGGAIAKIDRRTDQDLHVACVFLIDDPDSIVSRYGQLFTRLRERGVDVIAVSQDGRDGPGALGLNRTVSQTIILAKNGKVTRNFVFRQGMLFADPHVMGGIAELIGEDRENVAAWLAEADDADARMQMRDPQVAAKAEFREKLGEFVKAGKITRKEAGELYRAAFPESR